MVLNQSANVTFCPLTSQQSKQKMAKEKTEQKEKTSKKASKGYVCLKVFVLFFISDIYIYVLISKIYFEHLMNDMLSTVLLH